jgi:hypothetical protein
MTAEFLDWVVGSGVSARPRLVLLIALAFLATRAVRAVGRRLADRLSRLTPDPERRSRLISLLLIGQGTAQVVVVALAVLMTW